MSFQVWIKARACAAAVAATVVLAACGGGTEPEAVTTPLAALQRPQAQAAAVHTSAVPILTAAGLLMDYAESSLAAWFPGPKSSQSLGPFLFRSYPETGVYLGVIVSASPGYVVGDVYVVGPPFGNTLANPRNVGPLTNYITPVDPAAGSSLVISAATNAARDATYAPTGGVFAGTGQTGWSGQTADGKVEMEMVWGTDGAIKRAHIWFYDTPSTLKFFGCDGGKAIPCTGVAFDSPNQKLTFTNVMWSEVDADLSGAGADKPVAGGEHFTINGSIDAK